MTETYRYIIDRVDGSEFEWQIFDAARKGTPLVYLLYGVTLDGVFNFQLVLTSYDAIEAAAYEFPVFGPELWSTQCYIDPEIIEDMMLDVIDSIQETDIENPVELAYLYGGHVRSSTIRIPQISNSN